MTVLRTSKLRRSQFYNMSLPRNIFNSALYTRIRDVWFEGLPSTATAPTEYLTKKWFPRDKDTRNAFDSVCRVELNHALDAIGPKSEYKLNTINSELIKEVDNSSNPTLDLLSLVILLDQIPRNLYRTKETLPLVYNHYDKLALQLVQYALKQNPRPDLNEQVRYRTALRMWYYLPLVHSENLEIHRECQRNIKGMMDDAKSKEDTEAIEFLNHNLEYEEIHANIIEKFGRFPHRNDCLSRESTEEEKKWLEEGGHTFGVGDE